MLFDYYLIQDTRYLKIDSGFWILEINPISRILNPESDTP
jgi:hypothetical protein